MPSTDAHSNPRRVLHVFGQLHKAGAESRTMDLYRTIDRSDFQFDFVVMKPGKHYYFDEIRQLGGRIFLVRPPRESNPVIFIRDLMRLMRSAGPFHAVHVHTGFNAGLVHIAARGAGIRRRISHSRSAPPRYGSGILAALYTRLMRQLILRLSTDLIACGSEAARYLFGEGPLDRNEVLIVRNAIPVSEWADQSEAARREPHFEQRSRAALGLRPSGPIIGSVATLRAVKNHRFLINVFAEFHRHHPDASLVIAGEGELRNELQELVGERGLGSAVRFLGHRDDIVRLLTLFDVKVLPSRYEGIPGVIVESQACGTPALLSDTVTKEVDVEAGLVRYQSLHAPIKDWVSDLEALLEVGVVGTSPAREYLVNANYDVATAAELVVAVYRRDI